MRAAESQIDRHLVVEFSGVVFSTVGVGVTVSCRGARHYGVVAVAVVVVVVVLVIIIVVVVVASSVVVAAVFFVVLVLPVFTPPIVVVVLRLVVVVAAATATAAVVNSRRVSHGCRSPGGSAVLLVWWYRGCETPSVRAVQLAWSSDPVTRPAKGVGGVPFVGQRERAIERRSGRGER